MYGYSTARARNLTSFSHFSGLLPVSAHHTISQIMTLNRDKSVSEGTLSPFPFHTTTYLSPRKEQIYTMSSLLSVCLCLLYMKGRLTSGGHT